jgi:hypothetical protein
VGVTPAVLGVQLMFRDANAVVGLRPALQTLREASPGVAAEVGQAVSEGDYLGTVSLTTTAGSADLLHILTTMTAGSGPLKADVVAGVVHQVLPPQPASLRVVYPVARFDSLGRQAFCDYWLNEHSKIPRRIPGMHSYAQLHADDALTSAAADAIGGQTGGWDGCALVGHVDTAEFDRIMSEPIFTEEAVADMATFVDQELSSFNLFQVNAF